MPQKICQINPNEPSTWRNKRFLQFDVDWCHEYFVEDCLRLLDEHNVSSTWYATHKSVALDNVAASDNVEIGIHPNFIPLLKGDTSQGRCVEEVVIKLLEYYPDAKVSKSHSLVESSYINQKLKDLGITHENSTLIDSPSMQPLSPWNMWNGLVKVPLCWEDDYYCVSQSKTEFSELLEDNEGLKVFGFHPIHIFLNTEDLARYEAIRTFQRDIHRMEDYIYEGNGTRTKFIELLEALQMGADC